VKSIETRKTIALAMSAAYIIFTGYCIVTGKSIPQEKELGKVGYRIQPLDSGQKQKIYLLSEPQASYLITPLENYARRNARLLRN
jgi:hypothetical protein